MITLLRRCWEVKDHFLTITLSHPCDNVVATLLEDYDKAIFDHEKFTLKQLRYNLDTTNIQLSTTSIQSPSNVNTTLQQRDVFVGYIRQKEQNHYILDVSTTIKKHT